MGREIRRVPVDFNHPIVWRARIKRRPTFETMRAEILGEQSAGVTISETRWVHELAPMWGHSLTEAQREWDAAAEKCQRDGTLERVWTQDDLDRWRRERPTHMDDIAQIERDLGKPIWASVEDYCGPRPSEHDGAHYQPDDWPPAKERGYVVYETVSEGTPITPCFATPEGLIEWLVEKGTAWDAPMSPEIAERFVRGHGFLPSIVVANGVLRSGLEVADLAAGAGS